MSKKPVTKTVNLRMMEALYNSEIKPKNEFQCPKCYKRFIATRHYQICCSAECDAIVDALITDVQEKRANGCCLDCGLRIRNPKKRRGATYCVACKKKRDYQSFQRCLEKKKAQAPKKKVSAKNNPRYRLIKHARKKS